MKKFILIKTLGATVLLLSACASTQSLEQVCAAPNLQQASEKAIKRMNKDARLPLRALEISSKSWGASVAPSKRDIVKLSETMEDLRVRLKQGRGMYTLKSLSNKCETPKLMTDSLSRFFASHDLSENLMQTVKALPVYTYMLNSPLEHWRSTPVQVEVPLPRMEDF